MEGSSRNVSYFSNFISQGYADKEVIHITLDSIAAIPMEQKCKDSDLISALTFPEDAGLSANKIATLLTVTSALEPMYRLMNMQYYWFVATMFEASKRLFPGAQEDFKKHNGGRWHWIWTLQKSSMDVVCEKYDKAQTALDAEIEQECRAEQEQEEARQWEIEEHWAAMERECKQCWAVEGRLQIAKGRLQIAEEERDRECKAAERARAAAEEIAKLQRELEASMAEASTRQA